jgi:pilus assembly protein CpaB
MAVLGIDQLSDDDHEKPVVARTATLEATPEEAQKLALSQELGSLSLALRNAESVEKVSTNRVAARDLVSIREKPPQLPITVRIRYADGSVVYREVRP